VAHIRIDDPKLGTLSNGCKNYFYFGNYIMKCLPLYSPFSLYLSFTCYTYREYYVLEK
jgi:hypothetical protein